VVGFLHLVKQVGSEAWRIFAQFGIDPARVVPISSKERDLLAYSGLGWAEQQYAAFQIACASTAMLISASFLAIFVLAFGIAPYSMLAILPFGLFAILAARMHLAGISKERERDVDANLLDALRHLASELKGGKGLLPALSEIERSGYGGVSELLGHALALIAEGETAQAAFREAGEKTSSQAFRSFAATLVHATASGADLSGVIARFSRELELSHRNALAIYANECSKLSTITVVATGVLPGLLVFALVESGFVFGFKIPVEAFLISYLFLFPIAKYSLQAKLGLSNPGA